jgi:phage terminase Nu1 subunit (DNA packaging protein)
MNAGPTVTTKQLAEALGVTPRRINQLSSSSVLPMVIGADGLPQENAWNLDACVAAYITFRKDRLSKSSTDAEKLNDKLRLLRGKAEECRIASEEMLGELMSSQLAKALFDLFRSTLMDRIEQAIKTLAPLLVGQKDLVTVATLLEDEVHKVLNDVASERTEEKFEDMYPEFCGVSDSDPFLVAAPCVAAL